MENQSIASISDISMLLLVDYSSLWPVIAGRYLFATPFFKEASAFISLTHRSFQNCLNTLTWMYSGRAMSSRRSSMLPGDAGQTLTVCHKKFR